MRITGGQFRSRALVAPRGQETRPTSDRVREALFSMLMSDGVFEGSRGVSPFETSDGETRTLRVLDLYAGSGALAFEALSRGASSAVLVESARPAQAAIRENVAALGLENEVTLLTRPCEKALETVTGSFELVLIDPPYALVSTKPFAGVLAAAGNLVSPGGTLVLEHEAKDEPEAPTGLVVDRRRRHGDTILSLFRRP